MISDGKVMDMEMWANHMHAATTDKERATAYRAMGKLAKDVKAAVRAGDLTKPEAKRIMESAEPSSPLKELGSQTRRSGSTVEQMRARLHAEVADNKRAAERAGQAHTPDEGGAAHRAGTSRSHARGSETPEPQAKRACRLGGGENAVERVEGHVTDTTAEQGAREAERGTPHGEADKQEKESERRAEDEDLRCAMLLLCCFSLRATAR